jgi:RNA polymerase sigma-70 factor (ECF subfamily)
VERVVFLLADVFSVPFDEIAEVVDKTPAACRQIASRARHRVQQDRPRFRPTDDEAWEVARAFLVAAADGDIESVTALLAPEVVEVSDGGADHRAGRHPIVGPHRVARLIVNLARRAAEAGMEVTPQAINGQPGVVITHNGRIHTALAVSVVEGHIDRIWAVVNPEKTATVDSSPIP